MCSSTIASESMNRLPFIVTVVKDQVKAKSINLDKVTIRCRYTLKSHVKCPECQQPVPCVSFCTRGPDYHYLVEHTATWHLLRWLQFLYCWNSGVHASRHNVLSFLRFLLLCLHFSLTIYYDYDCLCLSLLRI